MVKQILKISMGIIAFLISFVAVILPWNLRFAYTMKVCNRVQKFVKKSKLMDSVIKSTVEDHGMEMEGRDG